MTRTNNFRMLILLLCCFSLIQCSKEDDVNSRAGNLIVKITDAASDDDNIRGIFITVSQIKLDDKPIRNFVPQTIEISSLQKGKTKILTDRYLPAKEYKKISLVLAAHLPDNPLTPGCYVLTKSNIKHNLITENKGILEIEATKEFELIPDTSTELVVDFDLRKAVIRTESTNNKYVFVTENELNNAVRIAEINKTGSIYGKVTSFFTDDYLIYVLLYRKGDFKASEEGTGAGESNILFSNAVTSSTTASDGSYNFAFIEKGEYDIRLAALKKNDSNEYDFIRFIPTRSRRSGTIPGNIHVVPGTATEVDIEVFRLF